jgi:hypothetical protein
MPNSPTDNLDEAARNRCLAHAVEIMKAQKYGSEHNASPAETLGKLYEKLKELARDVRAGG